MNRQRTFNKVRDHLLRQNEKALRTVGESSECVYRSTEGLKCAIGCLIKTKYYPAMEYEGIHDIADELFKYARPEGENDFGLLEDLQNVHDHVNEKVWKRELKKLAQTHGLTP